VPRLQGSWSHGNGELQLELRQHQPKHLFRLPLELELQFEDGTHQRESIVLDGPERQFTFKVEQAPVAVVLDPETRMLVRGEITRKE